MLEVEHDGRAGARRARALVALANGVRAVPPRRRHARAAADAPARRVERTLLRGLENPRDGYLDRLLSRRCSRPLTPLLLRTALSPNAVTVVGIAARRRGRAALGAPGALARGAGGRSACSSSGVLDCSDGELARLRFSESRLGHWLDVTGDTFVHVGAARAASRSGSRAAGAVPGWPRARRRSALGVVGAFAVDHLERADGGAPPAGTRTPGRTASSTACSRRSPRATGTSSRSPSRSLGRLDWLVPAAAVGAHVFWLTVVVLVLRALAPTRARQVGV